MSMAINTLFVSGLPNGVNAREVDNLFRRRPGFDFCQLKKYTGHRNRVVAFATFIDHQSAIAALHALNGVNFDPQTGHTLRVELARSNSRRKQKPDSFKHQPPRGTPQTPNKRRQNKRKQRQVSSLQPPNKPDKISKHDAVYDANLFPTTTNKNKEVPVSASMENREQCHSMEEMDEDIRGNLIMPALSTADFYNMQADYMVEKSASPTQLNLNVEDITDNFHCEQDVGENVEDATEKVVASISPEESVQITTIKESERNCFHSDDSSINVPDASLPVQNPDTIHEQQNEEHSKMSVNKKRTRASKIDQKKKNSLAIVAVEGSGSCSTNGVRRSNRIKSKPLEFWKGERLLYARVNDSLPSIVGVKYISPADTSGKAGFKVDSFVADEYKDLVEWASLH